MTDAHAAAFQTISADNHLVHYHSEWERKHGHSAPVVHGLQVLACTAPGATLFPHFIGEGFLSFLEVSCTFLAEVHSGDTLYPALTISGLEPTGDYGTAERYDVRARDRSRSADLNLLTACFCRA